MKRSALSKSRTMETNGGPGFDGLGGSGIAQHELGVHPILDMFGSVKEDNSMESFWESRVKPIEPLSHKGTATFQMEGIYNSFIDPGSMRLQGKIRVRKRVDNAAAVNLDSSDNGKVTLINYWVHALIQSAHVSMNGTSVASLSASEYAYKAFLEKIATFSKEAALSHGVTEGYQPDCDVGDNMEKVVERIKSDKTKDADQPKYGNEIRSEWLCTNGGVIGFCAALNLDFCALGKLWLDMLPINLCLTLSDDKFFLLTTAPETGATAKKVEYFVEYLDLALTMRRVKLLGPMKERIEKSLMNDQKAIYTFTKSTVKKYHIPKDQTNFSWNQAVIGKLPHHTVMTFVSQSAVNGDLMKNPFRLQHFNCKEVYYTFNGTEFPCERYRPEWGVGMSYLKEYGKFIDELVSGRFNSSHQINHEAWANSARFLLACDQSVDSCSGFHHHDTKRGSMSIFGSFKEALTENVVLILYCSFRDQIQIDAARRVYTEGSLTAL